MAVRAHLPAAVIAVSALLALDACGGSSPGLPTGTVDSGFRPAANGFPFPNYGNELPAGVAPTNLTPHDVQAMFGDGVCADAHLRRCDLIPEARAWLDSTNQAMAAGHCYGFSVLAELLWRHKVNVATLGAAATSSLAIDDNPALQRLIAYDWALQLLPSVQSKRIAGTPNVILARLGSVLRPNAPETYTLVFWKQDGTAAHAVTPYEVLRKGGGRFDVLIYDNNWPGRPRSIQFDTAKDTWTYHAAINPGVPDSTYRGDAHAGNMTLLPTSPGLGLQRCPFCAKVPSDPRVAGRGPGNVARISLRSSAASDANLIIADAAGRKLGYIKGALVNQIPGATVQRVAADDFANRLAPDFLVPADATYTITIDGTRLTHANSETLAVLGPSYDLTVKGIPMHPGERDTLVIEPDATKLSYTSSRREAPTLELGVSDSQAEYSFEIAGISDGPGSTTNVDLPAEGGSLTTQIVGPARVSRVSVSVSRSSEGGVRLLRRRGVPLRAGESLRLDFGSWTNRNTAMRVISAHEGGVPAQTVANEAAGGSTAFGA